MSLERVAPLLNQIIRQGIREGVMTTPYPDQAGEMLFSLIHSLGDKFSGLLLSYQPERDDLGQLEFIVAAYNEALERVLGAPPSSIEIIDDATVREWFLFAGSQHTIQGKSVAEGTLQPVRALGVDAAILFADILLPVIPLGLGLESAKGEGPLIGFCGAPFTLASYMIEGRSTREFLKIKTLMYSSPVIWHELMERLAVLLSDYLLAQIRAGAQAVQVFDSWVGALSPQDYEDFVLPYSQKVLSAAQAEGVPVIHFGTNAATLLPLMKRADGDMIGLDWRIPLDQGWNLIGEDVAVQGNLDPSALFAPLGVIKPRVFDILRRALGRPGHIFNLGHGILQHTPVDHVKVVVEMVHKYEH